MNTRLKIKLQEVPVGMNIIIRRATPELINEIE